MALPKVTLVRCLPAHRLPTLLTKVGCVRRGGERTTQGGRQCPEPVCGVLPPLLPAAAWQQEKAILFPCMGKEERRQTLGSVKDPRLSWLGSSRGCNKLPRAGKATGQKESWRWGLPSMLQKPVIPDLPSQAGCKQHCSPTAAGRGSPWRSPRPAPGLDTALPKEATPRDIWWWDPLQEQAPAAAASNPASHEGASLQVPTRDPTAGHHHEEGATMQPQARRQHHLGHGSRTQGARPPAAASSRPGHPPALQPRSLESRLRSSSLQRHAAGFLLPFYT